MIKLSIVIVHKKLLIAVVYAKTNCDIASNTIVLQIRFNFNSAKNKVVSYKGCIQKLSNVKESKKFSIAKKAG